MKDIPVFTTEHGAAALSLQQIPYTGFAHITIHSTLEMETFLQECVAFCRAVGAQSILACGHDQLGNFPVYSEILQMQMPLPEDFGEACLFPVMPETADKWLEIYNRGMKNVPNAMILSKQQCKELVEKGISYFVHLNGELMGIGIVDGDTIQGVVSCQKGAGETVMKALCGAVFTDVVRLEVAENNIPAMRLYHRMGFVATGVLKTWYDVTNFI